MSKAERLAQLIVAGLMTSARPLVPGTQEAWTKHVAEFLEPHLVGEWRDIESVPKDDGEEIILWIPAEGGLVLAFWDNGAQTWDTYCDGWVQKPPSHWMPLPPPPKGEQS